VSLRPDIRQTSNTCPDDVHLPSEHLLRIEKLLCKLAPSGRFSSTSGRLPVLERFTDSFQVSRKGRSINRSDDVVSRPDAYLRKARIGYGNCVLKFSRPDTPAPWSGRAEACYGNYLQRTCVRPDDRAIPSGRPWSTVRTAPRKNLPDAHSDPQPINMGPWALRAARIRCEFH
jgi:hypothetical protein